MNVQNTWDGLQGTADVRSDGEAAGQGYFHFPANILHFEKKRHLTATLVLVVQQTVKIFERRGITQKYPYSGGNVQAGLFNIDDF